MVDRNKSIVLLKKETRILLSKIGRKEQTYDELIMELIILKNKMDKLEDKSGDLHHSSLSIDS